MATNVAYIITDASPEFLDCVAESAESAVLADGDSSVAASVGCKDELELLLALMESEGVVARANPDWRLLVDAAVLGGSDSEVAFAAAFDSAPCARGGKWFVAFYTASGRLLEARAMNTAEFPDWLVLDN